MPDKNLGKSDGFRTRQVGETEPQHGTAETHSDGIAQRDILGINSLTTVGDGGGI